MAENSLLHVDRDEVPPLHLKPSPTLNPKYSPNIRRHFSVPTINLEKLKLFQDEQKDLEQDDKNANAINNTFTELMQQDAVEFADQLQYMTEEIKQQKDLPSKPIIIGLLNVLNLWIQHHGITTIHKLTQCIDKCDGMVLEHEKQKLILQQTIEEYKNECVQHQERHTSSNDKNEELNNKLNHAKQELEQAEVLQQQIVSENQQLRADFDGKSAENERNLNTIITQQKSVNQLKTETIQFENIIDAQKMKLSKMALKENELKNRVNELKDINKKYKETEEKYNKLKMENEELFKEKKIMQNKLTDYGKLKDNLDQYKLNENALDETNMDLKHKNNVLRKEIHLLKEASPVNCWETKAEQRMFIDFNDEVHTYNMEGNAETKNKEIEPRFDEDDFKEFMIGNDEKNDDRDGMFRYRTMYRSFVLVGIGCLCYLVYSQLYYGSSFHKAKQIQERYKKWKRSLDMKKRVPKTQ